MSSEHSINSLVTAENFWDVLNILFTKFNVINRRVWSSKILHRHICKPLSKEWSAPLKNNVRKLCIEDIENYTNSIIKDFNLSCDDTQDNHTNIEILIIELFPKKFTNVNMKAYQLICLDKNKLVATFYNVTAHMEKYNLCPDFTYSLSLENGNIVLRITENSNLKSQDWLINTLLPQLVKWCANNKMSTSMCKESLSLISTDKYYTKYNELKLKYGKALVQIWPECTDPLKFVYEDVAIATYLLILWEKDSENIKKTFVDLGCGNGLLVYILTKEGHNGIGIDVRKRRIWDLYPKDIKLEERTIVPSDVNLFPNTDWLIGNHSDELTPWIPVVAARSSYNCNFFLLPCCAYNFDGSKYQRKNSSQSQYTEYLEYIKSISCSCGFETSVDRLKIPSTKRICLVGEKRYYLEQDHNNMCNKIQNLVVDGSIPANGKDTSWITNFKPRDAVERVRNCTQIDKQIIESVTGHITNYLLEDYNLKDDWSVGKTVNINDLVTLLPEEYLKAMKSECGGLQTLLKNNNHIFSVQKGKVKLRYPRTIEEVQKSNYNSSNCKMKMKPCWFYNNHPHGCPLQDSFCSYSHVKN